MPRAMYGPDVDVAEQVRVAVRPRRVVAGVAHAAGTPDRHPAGPRTGSLDASSQASAVARPGLAVP